VILPFCFGTFDICHAKVETTWLTSAAKNSR
jgi:hypothetical protein